PGGQADPRPWPSASPAPPAAGGDSVGMARFLLATGSGMRAAFTSGWSGHGDPSLGTCLFRLVVLLLPTGLLLGAALRSPGAANTMLWLASAFQGLVCLLTFLSRPSWRQPVGPSVITLYLIALAWVWLADAQDDWYTHFLKSILLVVPLSVFAVQTLTESGAPALRRARVLAQLLQRRKEWPADLGACRALPEVKALRAALHIDAT